MLYFFANINAACICPNSVALTTYGGKFPIEQPFFLASGSPPILVPFGYRGRQLLSVQVKSPALAGSAAWKAELVQLETTDSQAFVS